MTLSDVTSDRAARTLTMTADFTAQPEQVWQLWADPRLLERWWGPPTYPATVTEHDLNPGGRVAYFMTGPEGGRYHGWWRVLTVEAPTHLQFEDGFADAEGRPDPDLPVTTTTVEVEGTRDGTRMVLRSRFATDEAMEQLLAMGAQEGLSEAMGQMDALLLELVDR